jgi:hypothetical protein
VSGREDPVRDPEVAALAERLQRSRPLPRPAFRGGLGRELAVHLERFRGPRLRRLALVYALSGALLLGVAALSVAGVGPLAA